MPINMSVYIKSMHSLFCVQVNLVNNRLHVQLIVISKNELQFWEGLLLWPFLILEKTNNCFNHVLEYKNLKTKLYITHEY